MAARHGTIRHRNEGVISAAAPLRGALAKNNGDGGVAAWQQRKRESVSASEMAAMAASKAAA
jgi:hypothetical protein